MTEGATLFPVSKVLYTLGFCSEKLTSYDKDAKIGQEKKTL